MTRRAPKVLFRLTLLALTVALAGVVGCKTAPDKPDESAEPTGPYAELIRMIPKSDTLDLWQRDGQYQIFVGAGARPAAEGGETYAPLAQSSFAAEAPLLAEYGHRVSLVQNFKKSEGQGQVVLEIHEMNTADDAFGIFSVTAGGDPVTGSWTQARRTPTQIVFAKDRYLVRATAGAPADSEAAMQVANKVAGVIFGRGRLPTVVMQLPVAGRVEGTTVYLHGPLGLKAAQTKLGVKDMVMLLGPILGNAPMAAATYQTEGAGANTVFIMNRRLATDTPPLERLDRALADAPPAIRNSFAYTVADERYIVVGTFDAEEESIQRIIPQMLVGITR